MDAGTAGRRETRELTETLESLQRLYEGHIGVEDREVFPAASRLLVT